MNLAATVALRAGGPGSGPRPGMGTTAYNKVSPADALKKEQWEKDVEEMGVDRRIYAKKKRKKLKGAGGQTDSSSFIGRKYRVVDTKYGHEISEHDNPEDAEHTAQARPWSKVLSEPNPAQTPEVRDIARQRLVKTNPNIDN